MAAVLENLHARKQTLLEQIETTKNAEQRNEIQRELDQINTALDFLDRPEPSSE